MANIYRRTWRSVIQAPMILYLGISLLLTGAIIFYVLINSKTNLLNSGIDTVFFLGLCVLEFGIFLGLVALLILLVSWTFGYLKVSANGLEYHRWPINTIECMWSEVEKIQQGSFNGKTYATLLIRRREPGREISLGIGTLGSALYKGIPLSDFRGWPDGNLAIELRRYIPNLFDIKALNNTEILDQSTNRII